MDMMLARLCDCMKTGQQEQLVDDDIPSHKYRGFPYEESVNTLLPLSNNRVVFGAGDGGLASFCYDTGEQTFTWNGHDKSITQICHRSPEAGSSTTSHIFSASRDLSVRMWDVGSDDRQHKQEFTGLHDLVVSSVACHPDDSNMICTGSRDNNVALWDVNSGTAINNNKIARNLVTDICWKGDLLAQTSEDKSLRLWDSRTLEVTRTFVKKQQILTSCDVSGNYIVTSCGGFNGSGCEITLWDSRGGDMPVLEFKGHREKVHRCCYVTSGNNAGQFVVSLSADHSIKLWNLNTFTEQSSFNVSHQLTTIAQLPSEDPETIRLGVGCFENSGVVIVTVNVSTNQWAVYDG